MALVDSLVVAGEAHCCLLPALTVATEQLIDKTLEATRILRI